MLSEFYARKTGHRAGQYYEKCKECTKIRGRNYYHVNKERQLPLALIRKHRAHMTKQNYINSIKDVPCADCGYKFHPVAMDFDHRVHTDKIKNIGTMMVKNWSLDRIKTEIEKCDIVCANCHRIRTYFRYAEVAKVVKAGA